MNLFKNKLKKSVYWVDVNSRLPVKRYGVLVTDINGFVFESWLDDNGNWIYDGYDEVHTAENVTHWCVFPKSPNE